MAEAGLKPGLEAVVFFGGRPTGFVEAADLVREGLLAFALAVSWFLTWVGGLKVGPLRWGGFDEAEVVRDGGIAGMSGGYFGFWLLLPRMRLNVINAECSQELFELDASREVFGAASRDTA